MFNMTWKWILSSWYRAVFFKQNCLSKITTSRWDLKICLKLPFENYHLKMGSENLISPTAREGYVFRGVLLSTGWRLGYVLSHVPSGGGGGRVSGAGVRVYPPDNLPLPRRSACHCRGRYASYCNAFLLIMNILRPRKFMDLFLMNENSLLSMAKILSREWWDGADERCIHPRNLRLKTENEIFRACINSVFLRK